MTEAAAIAALVASPLTTRRCGTGQRGRRKPSTRQIASLSGGASRSSASARASMLVTCSPRRSIPAAQRTTTLTRSAARSTHGHISSRWASVICLESCRPLRARRSACERLSWSMRTAAATSGPARQPRPASSAPATWRLPSPRSKANRRRLRASRRRWNFPFGALEPADAVWGPVGGKGLADDPVSGDRSPETAVVTCPTVVAHHEVHVGWNLDLFRHIALFAAAAGVDVGLVALLDPVDDRVAAFDGQGVPRSGDDALDEVLVGLPLGRLRAWFALVRSAADDSAFGAVVGSGRRVEDDDVADLRVLEVVEEAVDENALADVERWLHRFRGDLVRLDDPGLDRQRQPQGQRNDDGQLNEPAAFRFRLR